MKKEEFLNDMLMIGCRRTFLRLLAKFRKIIYPSSEYRIIKFLKFLAKEYGVEVQGSPSIRKVTIKFTYKEIANLTSTTTNTVRKVFDLLIEKEIVSYVQKSIFIKNMKEMDLINL